MRRLTRRVSEEESGAAYAAVEMVLVLGFILLPLLAGLAQLPRWVDAESATNLAAQEAARTIVLADSWEDGRVDAERVVATILENRGLDVGSVERIEFTGDLARGASVTVTVTINVPPVVMPGVGPIGGTISVSRAATERVDDFREIG